MSAHVVEDSNPIDVHESTKPEASRNPAINKWFKACVKLASSDLHLKAGQPPIFRLKGDLKRAQELPLSNTQIEEMVFEILTPKQKQYYFERGAIDFAHDLEGSDRFRVNVFRQRGHTSVAARRVTAEIKSYDELHLPPSLSKIAEYHQGLVLLAGITGAGKSTTIAAMIDQINNSRACHIVTIEDPIEYLYHDKKAVINQREIGIDVPDFHAALKYLMREDPDVVLIGEMRDRETFEAAMHAAETGHLVFGTIHASSSSQTITRILDLFPEEARNLIRQSLVFNLRSIICQKLLPSLMDNVPRVPVCEIMIANAPIRKLIAEGRDFDINAVLKTAKSEGMQDYNTALYDLVQREWIDVKTAYDVAPNPDELKMMLKGIRSGQTGILG